MRADMDALKRLVGKEIQDVDFKYDDNASERLTGVTLDFKGDATMTIEVQSDESLWIEYEDRDVRAQKRRAREAAQHVLTLYDEDDPNPHIKALREAAELVMEITEEVKR